MTTISFVMPAAGHWIHGAEIAGLDCLWFYEPGSVEKKTIRANFPKLRTTFLGIPQRPSSHRSF